jgi:hypothetical protein
VVCERSRAFVCVCGCGECVGVVCVVCVVCVWCVRVCVRVCVVCVRAFMCRVCVLFV